MSQKPASLVVSGIGLELQTRRLIFEKNVLIFEMTGRCWCSDLNVRIMLTSAVFVIPKHMPKQWKKWFYRARYFTVYTAPEPFSTVCVVWKYDMGGCPFPKKTKLRNNRSSVFYTCVGKRGHQGRSASGVAERIFASSQIPRSGENLTCSHPRHGS